MGRNRLRAAAALTAAVVVLAATASGSPPAPTPAPEAARVPDRFAAARSEELAFLNHLVLAFDAYLGHPDATGALGTLEGIVARGRRHREQSREALQKEARRTRSQTETLLEEPVELGEIEVAQVEDRESRPALRKPPAVSQPSPVGGAPAVVEEPPGDETLLEGIAAGDIDLPARLADAAADREPPLLAASFIRRW